MSILPQPLRQALKHVVQGLSNALPGSCLLCAEDSGSRVICADCLAELPGMPPQCCPSCAEQTSYGERCGACLHKAPHFDKVVAGFRYDFPVDRIIHSLKYGHQLSVAEWLGERLSTQLTASDHDLIIPLPLHPARLLERGFNQSMEIARALGKALNRPVEYHHLQRTRPTRPQADLPHKERHKNVAGAFECRKDYTGQRILLVDDVMTTGSTLNECARILKIHGAETVSVAVAARTLKH